MRVLLLAFAAVLFVVGGIARAEDISGPIVVTKTIFEDSRLVGDVTCAVTATPCLDFGASHIKLRLNGFSITGPAEPDNPASPNSCASVQPANADGIRILNQTHVQVLGPGFVQRFRRHGIFMVGTAGVSSEITIRHVTSHHNCFSGLLTAGISNSVMEDSVSVKNAGNSGASPCGGNCLVNSHGNRIRRNQFSGKARSGRRATTLASA